MRKQPKGLKVFFLTEMWERYGFTMVEILLVLYLINVFGLTDNLSYGVLGSVTALAYVNSVIGGYLADRFIGHRGAVLLGAVMLSLAYACLASLHNLEGVYIALTFLALGTGLFKPNVSSLVGTLYEENDERRHGGFTIFYIGINVGNMLAMGVSGYIQEYYGWHITYLTAVVMMLVAFATFWVGSRFFKIHDVVENIVHKKKDWYQAVGILVLTLLVSYFIIKHQRVALWAFSAIALYSIGVVIYEAFHEQGRSRTRVLAFLVLVAISVVYWAMFFQVFFSMNLFVDRAVSHQVWDWTFATSTFAAMESIGVILFGIVLGKLWTGLGHSRWSPGTPMKFSLGLFTHALAFGVLFLSMLILNAQGMVMPGWVIVVYLIIALGELLLSPTGLAMVTELVPQRLVGTMMGVFFISLGLGGKLAGVFANISAIPQDMTDVGQIEHVYHHAFLVYFMVCLGAALVSLALVPLLNKLIDQQAAER